MDNVQITFDSSVTDRIDKFNNRLRIFNQMFEQLHHNTMIVFNRLTILWILTLIVYCFK